MIIAFPVEKDEGLNSKISMHFGRTRYFAFVNVEENKVTGFTVKQNPYEEHGMGDLPRFIRENGANIIVAYGMGEHAIDFFREYRINVITGAMGNIKDVTEAMLKDNLMVDESWKEKEDFKHKD